VKNRFYEENFAAFIKENEKFFSSHKTKFIKNFVELLKFKNPNLTINQKLKDEILRMYESLFIKDFNTQKFKIDAIFLLKDKGANLKDILNKSFLLLANAYIKFILKEEEAIVKLKKLASLLEFYIEYLLYHANEEEFFAHSLPKELKEYYISNVTLNLFNVYKGVPITHKTPILSLNEEEKYIEVKANPYQIIAAKFKREIYLLEPKSNATFKAYIEEIYPKSKILKLSNIEKIQRNTPKRNFIRVQPSQDVEVIIKKHNNSYKTKLYDISLKGMAVIGLDKIVDVGDIINVEFTLENYFFDLTAEVRSISKTDDLFRFHLYFEPNSSQERVLEKYITKREKEIIKELHKYLKKEFIDV